MFQIKETQHNLTTNYNPNSSVHNPSSLVKTVTIETNIEYYGKYTSLKFAQEQLMKLILENLETLNKSPCNDFKVSFNDDSALAVIQCWTGKETEMTEEELESDRDYYNVLEYDIVYSGDVDVNTIPDEWLLA
jgi:hypothetical protein